MYSYLALIFFVLNILPQLTWGQSENTFLSRFAVFVGSGVTKSGTHWGLNYSVTNDLVVEGTYGFDFAILPFWALGSISDDKLYGFGLNWYPLHNVDFVTTVKSVFQQTFDDSNGRNRYYIAGSFGYSARVKSNLYTFLKYGVAFSMSNPDRKSELMNLEFGFGVQL